MRQCSAATFPVISSVKLSPVAIKIINKSVTWISSFIYIIISSPATLPCSTTVFPLYTNKFQSTTRTCPCPTTNHLKATRIAANKTCEVITVAFDIDASYDTSLCSSGFRWSEPPLPLPFAPVLSTRYRLSAGGTGEWQMWVEKRK